MSDELAFLDATAQADLVRRGKASATELVDAAISRIERVNGELNAVIMPLFDKARALAASRELPDGPLRGVPFLVKDIFCHTSGDPYHGGMKLLRRLGWTEKADTHLGQKFRAAGLVFVGRTNVPELGSLPTTEPDAYGPTRNPWDTARSSGGSGGGAAAAVAAAPVPAAHANDGRGSIRIPASGCGLVGLKPTPRRFARAPARPRGRRRAGAPSPAPRGRGRGPPGWPGRRCGGAPGPGPPGRRVAGASVRARDRAAGAARPARGRGAGRSGGP